MNISITDMSYLLGYKYPSGYLNFEKRRKHLTLLQTVLIFQKLNMGYHDVDVNNFTLHKLRKYRLEKGFTIKTMSYLLGYKYPSGYANIEYGKRMLSYSKAIQISDILGIPIEELFFANRSSKREDF